MCKRMGRPRRPLGTSLDSACAQRHHQLASFFVGEIFEVEGRVTLVAQEFDQRRPSFFHGRLDLTLGDAHKVHLERLGEEVFSVTAVRTRQ